MSQVRANGRTGSIGSIAHMFLSQSRRKQGTTPGVSQPASYAQRRCSQEQSGAFSGDGMVETVLLADHLSSIELQLRQYRAYRNGNDERVRVVDIRQPGAAALIRSTGRVVVVCHGDPDHIVAGYKTIKWLSRQVDRPEKVSVFFCNVPTAADAREAYLKLSGVAEEFLGMEVGFAGYGLRLTQVSGVRKADTEPVAEREGENRLEDSDYPTSKRSGGDAGDQQDVLRLHGQLSGKESEQLREREIRAGTAGPLRPAVLSPVWGKALPASDGELADRLQLALPGWLRSVPTALALPLNLPEDIAEGAAVLLDAAGRLWVLGASLAGGETLLARALAARKWLVKNLELLAGHCRQLRIDTGLEPGLILVTGSQVEPLRASCSQIGKFPCTVMQVHLLRAPAGYGLLIV